MFRLPAAQLAELRRLAYHFSDQDLAAAVQASGLPPDLVPLQVAATFAHVTLSYLRKRIRAGKLPSYRSGQRILVSLSRVVKPDWLTASPSPSAPPARAHDNHAIPSGSV